MKGGSDGYNAERDFKRYNDILSGKTQVPKNKGVQHKKAPLGDESVFSQIYSAIRTAGKLIVPIGIASSPAAAAYLDHSDNGHYDADAGNMQVTIAGFGSHGDGIRTPPSDDVGKSVDAYKKTKKVAHDSPIKMAPPSDPGIKYTPDKSPVGEIEKTDSGAWDWLYDGWGGFSESLSNLFGGFSDVFNNLLKQNNEAYATSPATSQKTEAQKIAERCKDPIYGPNADECKTTVVSQDNPQNPQSGAPDTGAPSSEAGQTALNQDVLTYFEDLKERGMKPISYMYGEGGVKKETTEWKDVYVANDGGNLSIFFEYPDGTMAEQQNNFEPNWILMNAIFGNGGDIYQLLVEDGAGAEGVHVEKYVLRRGSPQGASGVYGPIREELNPETVHIQASGNILNIRVENLYELLRKGNYRMVEIIQANEGDINKMPINTAKARDIADKMTRYNINDAVDKIAFYGYVNQENNDVRGVTAFFMDELFEVKK